MAASIWDLPRDTDRDQRKQLNAVFEQIDEYGKHSSLVVKAALLAAGYHQHHGHWRRRLDSKRNDATAK